MGFQESKVPRRKTTLFEGLYWGFFLLTETTICSSTESAGPGAKSATLSQDVVKSRF